MVTETQSRACIHQWWGLSVHWSNIYVKRLAEMLLVTVEVSSFISSALEQWFFQPRAHIKDLKIKAISFGFSQCHRKPAWNPNLVTYLYIHLLVRLPFHLSLARANATKRHLYKCGAGKHNCKKTVILPGTVPSASTRQRFAATSLFFYCWKVSLLQNLNVFCDMNVLSFGSRTVWQLHPCCGAAADVCSQTREQDVRI